MVSYYLLTSFTWWNKSKLMLNSLTLMHQVLTLEMPKQLANLFEFLSLSLSDPCLRTDKKEPLIKYDFYHGLIWYK